jgi:hypothetical protein
MMIRQQRGTDHSGEYQVHVPVSDPREITQLLDLYEEWAVPGGGPLV